MTAVRGEPFELGLCVLPESVRATVLYAELAEAGGARWLGVCDSPLSYADPHASIQAALRSTATIRIGTLVTNPVTRHWSVQASAFRTLDEVAPGRTFMGIGTGDTAVLDVGLRPARIGPLAEYVAGVRTQLPDSVRVLVAAGGPGSVRRASAYADELVLGQGASPAAVEQLGAIAEVVRAERGEPPIPKWLILIAGLVDRPDEEAQTRIALREYVVGQAAQAFSGTLESKGLDDAERDRVRRFVETGSIAGDAELEGLLYERFALVGTPEAAADRLHRIAAETGVSRVFLAIVASDVERQVRLAAERMFPRLLEAIPA
jgi:alkanesulfonate monooxygenase SsuD/methylene tetrahydromethanopterin reductase-like flavin-dependent oxidoreductase (luciferase family)